MAGAASIAALLALAAPTAPPPPVDPVALASRVDALAAGVKGVPGVVAALRAERPALDWRHAAGVRAFGTARAAPDDEFRIASVTKTYVAAAVLRLVEDGLLTLDAPIVGLLSAESLATLRGAGYRTDTMTVRHLLQHQAGLRDYATTRGYARAVASDPAKSWTRAEQVALAAAGGKPLFAPGARTRYSDTGYILVGEIVERLARQPLGEAVAGLLRFGELGLVRTRWEPAGAPQLPADRIHAYQDGVDTAAMNPSFDLHGGGGIVSTAPELLTFFEALVEGRVFARPATLPLMLAADAALPDRDGSIYGLGIERLDYGDVVCWGHKGHWATLAAWCPDIDAGYVFSLNAAGRRAYALAGEVHKAFASAMITLGAE